MEYVGSSPRPCTAPSTAPGYAGIEHGIGRRTTPACRSPTTSTSSRSTGARTGSRGVWTAPAYSTPRPGGRAPRRGSSTRLLPAAQPRGRRRMAGQRHRRSGRFPPTMLRGLGPDPWRRHIPAPLTTAHPPRVIRNHSGRCDRVPGGSPSTEAATMADDFNGQDRARHPRLDAGLGGVPRRTRRRRARRTCSSCSTTTPGWRPGRRTAGGSRCRRMDRLADERPDVLAVAHDGAVLADALVLPDRPQPPPERLRVRSPRPRPGFPGYNSHIPPENATMADVLRDAGWSTFWVGKNHNIPVDEWTMGSSKKRLAARPGLRPLLRLHRRRDQPVVSRPRRGQPLRRPAVPARGRLPPVQGPRRQGARVHPRLQAVRARQALVPVVLPGRQPRAAPRAAGVHRQVQGRVRRRLRGLPRVGAAADDRARASCPRAPS